MSRHHFYRVICLLFLFWMSLCGRVAAAEKPNIIFILTDDLGYGDLGVYYQNARRAAGQPAFHTPNLDLMAAQGVRMDRHYTAAPVCAPARGSLMTGMHQGHANIRDNQFDDAVENNHTLATVLQGAGYATAAIGKWGIGGNAGNNFPAHPLHRGFDFYFGVLAHTDAHFHYPKESGKSIYHNFENVTSQLGKAYSTDLYTARAKKWISDHHTTAPDQPFFLYLAYTAPHARLEVPTQAYPAGGMEWTGTPGAIINTASGTIDSWIHPDYAITDWPSHAKRHATMVRRLDDGIGDILQLLDTLEIGDNTLVVFTSDNGPHHESGSGGTITQDPRFFRTYGPLDGTKRDVWEGGIRVPALVRWPGSLPAGRVSTRPSQFHDWLATFAEIAGRPIPFRSDGVSILNDLTGNAPAPAGTVYVEYTTKSYTQTQNYTDFHASHRSATRGNMQALYVEGVKGVRYDVDDPADNFRVYETLADPQETLDLAGQPGQPSQSAFQNGVLRLRRVHPHDANSSPARAYDFAAVPAVLLSDAEPGVVAHVFEGDFPHVPTFDGLTPATTAVVQGFDLSPRTRDEDIGFRFTGWLHVLTTGEYEFFLTTDTGAVMRLHDILLLDADFGYAGGTERSSGAIILEAGYHPFRLHSRHAGPGSPTLALEWSGPGLVKQPVPASALVQEGPPGPPTASDIQTSTFGEVPVTIPVLPPGSLDDWAISNVDNPLRGSAQIVGGDILYTPAAGFYGTDTFTYTISDGIEELSASVTIEVFYHDPAFLWLPFDEGSGSTVHDAGGQPMGTLESSPDWTNGISGHALNFDGVNDFVAINPSYIPPAGATARTVSAWIRASNPGSIISWGLVSNTRKWHFRLDTTDGFTGRLRVEVEGGYQRGTTNLLDGEWHHVAAVLPEGSNNVNQIRLYVDGTEDTPYDSSAQIINTTATPVEIGRDNHLSPRYFPGQIDEVRIIHGALSADEIASLAATPEQSATAWHRRHYGPAPVDWLEDDLGDGATRLERLAMTSNPWADFSSERPQFIFNPDYYAFSYQRRISNLYPLAYEIEWSPDLDTWFENPDGILTVNPRDEVWEDVTLWFDPGLNPVFYRVRVKLEN